MIDYKNSLNPAQYAAATADDGPVLVVAGAGSGKTRTITYRLAWLYEQGIDPSALLLLTFTRKAAHEMLHRASQLLDHGLMGVQGGTFHAFAYSVLRHMRPAWLEGRNFSVLDSADIVAAIGHCKQELGLGKGDRSFPKSQNIVGILSKARNKEISIEEVVRREATHLLPHCEALCLIDEAYTKYRRTQGVLDYDDLLFCFEELLRENSPGVQSLRQRFRYIMVDEYQDTNLVQARLVRLLGAQEYGGTGNVMAVGDDAQSIYAFRGAHVQNILEFPNHFPGTTVVRLEENYRSTQPILDVANALLASAPEAFRKQLFTTREGGETVRHIRPSSDKRQADMVVRRIEELLEDFVAHDIAVLFRAGFHSYQLEIALNRAGIAFRKYGGVRFTEAAHIKDVLAYARLLLNPLDMAAFARVAQFHKGLGPKTVQKLYAIAQGGDAKAAEKAFKKYPEFWGDICFLEAERITVQSPVEHLRNLLEHYQPHLERMYPDDWPRRRQGIEELLHIANMHTELDMFLADIILESPEEEQHDEHRITLSTVHSAKGLEWGAVILIDLVEERFPSRHALNDAEGFEEERRLMYVACTRARRQLDLYAPSCIYLRGSSYPMPANPSPFILELPHALYEEWIESYGGELQKRLVPTAQQRAPRAPLAPSAMRTAGAPVDAQSATPATGQNATLGYCHHKIFGRGKIVKMLPPDKCQVNFSGFGLKVILQDFLTLEK